MSRSPSNFRQQDVSRAIKAAKVAGLDVIRVEVDRSGKIVLVVKDGLVMSDGKSEFKINPFDEASAAWPTRKRKMK